MKLLPYALRIKRLSPVLMRSVLIDVQSAPEFLKTRSEMPCQKHVRNFCQPAWNPIRIPASESALICRNCKLSARDVAVNSSPMIGSSSCANFRTPAGTAAGIPVDRSVYLPVRCPVYRPYVAIKQSSEMKALKLCITEGCGHSE